MANRKFIDMTGLVFDRLTVVSFVEERSKYRERKWLCRCECGNTLVTLGKSLRQKGTRSCGCLKGIGNIGDIPLAWFNKIKHHAKCRGISFNLTIEYLSKLYLEQDKKCYFSKLPIKFDDMPSIRANRCHSTSLDRLDSSNGYHEGNVALVHKDINLMKMHLPVERFISLCKSVTDVQKTNPKTGITKV